APYVAPKAPRPAIGLIGIAATEAWPAPSHGLPYAKALAARSAAGMPVNSAGKLRKNLSAPATNGRIGAPGLTATSVIGVSLTGGRDGVKPGALAKSMPRLAASTALSPDRSSIGPASVGGPAGAGGASTGMFGSMPKLASTSAPDD